MLIEAALVVQKTLIKVYKKSSNKYIQSFSKLDTLELRKKSFRKNKTRQPTGMVYIFYKMNVRKVRWWWQRLFGSSRGRHDNQYNDI
jgi:hypothetical protein